MTLADVLALLVVFVALPLSWTVTVALWVVARHAARALAGAQPGGAGLRAARGLAVLRVQLVFSLSVSLLVSVFALVFVNNDLTAPFLDPDQTRILTRGSLLLLSVVPSVYWIRRLLNQDSEPTGATRVDRLLMTRLVKRMHRRMDSQDVRQDEQDVRMDAQDERIDNPPAEPPA